MFRIFIIFAIVLSSMAPAMAQQSPFRVEGFIKADEYRTYAPASQANYVVGVYDGVMTMTVALRLRTNVVPGFARLEDCTRGWSAGQLTETVNRWLDRHPDTWSRYMGPLVVSALVEACNAPKR